MVVIFTTQPQTCPCKQCVPIPLDIMVYRTGHVCYVVVINDQILSYPVTRQIKIQQTLVQKYVFMST